jgi:hypothetical protein
MGCPAQPSAAQHPVLSTRLQTPEQTRGNQRSALSRSTQTDMSEAHTRATAICQRHFGHHTRGTAPPSIQAPAQDALSTRAHGSLGPATLPSCAALRARSEQGCLCEPVGLGHGPTRLVETRPAACALRIPRRPRYSAMAPGALHSL